MTAEFRADIEAIGRIPAVPAILEVVCRATGMGFAAVARVTDARWIACSVKDDVGFGLAAGGELPVESTICHEIRQHHAPVVIDDVAADAAWRAHHTPQLYGLQSYISVPITLPDGRFFGTLCAIDAQPHRLNTPETLGMFRLFAELIAFHLDANARLQASEANLLHEREVADLREQFIAVLGHDLRNPLHAVGAGVRLLQRHPERAAGLIPQIQGAVARMSGLIDNVLDFARGRLGGGIDLSRHAGEKLGPVLEQVIAELQQTHPDRVIRAVIALPDAINCDRARMGQLLSNLLGNALTHGDPGMPVAVSATCSAGVFTITVSNGGPAIPAAHLEKLFQPFSRASARPNQAGLGLGLYIAAEIARAHGGHLSVSSDDVETRFTFRMPLIADLSSGELPSGGQEALPPGPPLGP